jgi:predicted esterase
MKEVRIEVPRSARYYMLGTPGPQTSRVWIVCHGFAQLASRFLRRFEPILHDNILIVAPEALNRFYLDTSPRPHGPDALVGATWMTREDRDHEIHDYVRYLDRVTDDVFSRLDGRSPELLVLGFSQGVATVCRWFSHGRAAPERLVLCSGNIPSDLDLQSHAQKWRRTKMSIIWGDADPGGVADSVERDRQRLTSAGLDVEWLRFPGGHEIDPAMLAQLSPP